MRRRGFTLVEILIGSAVLAALAVGVFKVFGSSNRQNVQALWYSSRQAQARSLLGTLRNDIPKASCPTTISEDGVDRAAWSDSANHIQFANGVTDLTPGGGDVTLMSFAIRVPEYSGGTPPDRGDDPPWGSVSEVEVIAEGTNIRYRRSDGAAPPIDKILAEDVVQVEISAEPIDRSELDVDTRYMMDIRLEFKHPNEAVFPGARLEERTEARTSIPVVGS